jgi:hypothetical protein
MAKASVAITASRTNVGLAQAPTTKKMWAEAPLHFWARFLQTTEHEAKKIKNGMPTAAAVLARWWIEEYRPPQSDKESWKTCFDCACSWLSLDAEKHRRMLVERIEKVWLRGRDQQWRGDVYQKRARVLACAGESTAIARQFLLGLVEMDEFADAMPDWESTELFDGSAAS